MSNTATDRPMTTSIAATVSVIKYCVTGCSHRERTNSLAHTLHFAARLAGVSIKTVSNVVNNFAQSGGTTLPRPLTVMVTRML